MNTKRPDDGDLDDLLKSVFVDDLPDDAAAGMRARLRRFLAETMAGRPPVEAWGRLFRKRAWAALSVLMLLSGGLLQGLGSRNALSDRISALLDPGDGPDAGRPAALADPAGTPERRGDVTIWEKLFRFTPKERTP